MLRAQPARDEDDASVRGRRAANLVFAAFVLLGVLLTAAYLAWLDSWGAVGIDFRASTWDAARAIFDGRSPYPDAGSIERNSFPALYPPPYMLVFSPLSALPFSIAFAVWALVLAAAITGALWLVGLRDVRCYTLALLSLPAAASLGAGNATALLLLSTALLWRWRDRRHRGAAAFAAGLLVKPILWPVLVWLVVSRRFRLAIEAAVLVPCAALIGWMLIGFEGLAEYPDLLRAQSAALASNGLLSTNLLLDLGLSLWGAEIVSVAIGGVLLIASARQTDDVDRLALCITAALVLTPVMFVHYFLLLLIPLAIKFPRLSLLWFVPQGFWLVAFAYEDGTRPWWTSVVAMVLLATMVVLFGRGSRVMNGRTVLAG